MIFLHLVAIIFATKPQRHKDTKKDFNKQLLFVPLSLCGNCSGLSGLKQNYPAIDATLQSSATTTFSGAILSITPRCPALIMISS